MAGTLAHPADYYVRLGKLYHENRNYERALVDLEQALELTYNCINTLSDVAQDQSDRGLIAVMGQYGFRPLMEEFERVEAEECSSTGRVLR